MNITLENLANKICCNTCTLGKRLYDPDGDMPIGIYCTEKQNNNLKFDYICSNYIKDEEFIKKNKDIEDYIK